MYELCFKRSNDEFIRHKISKDVVSVGRAPGNDICLPDPDISRVHLLIERRGSYLVLTDKSSNGTFVNGEKISSQELQDSDVIRLGQWIIEVQKASPDFERETQIVEVIPTQVMSYQPDSRELTYQRWFVQEIGTDAAPIQLIKTNTSFGSAKGNDVQLSGPYVSSFHCRIENRKGVFFIKDLQSTNGVSVGGKKVVEAELPPNSEIEIGGVTLKFFPLEKREQVVPSQRTNFEGIISSDSRMREIFSVIERVAKSNATVLLQGESGVGKELLAHAVHRQSLRDGGPYITVNCGAISKDLIESELFGHEKGAFTSAHQQRRGLFEQAHGGTLFLDEIGELPLDLQSKLLRVLENGEIRRVGGTQSLQVDVRLIAATHKDLLSELDQGNFREDLFYRLYVVPIYVPPLRDRKGDIPKLVDFFIKNEFSSAGAPKKPLDASALDVLCNHSWPGNIRELKNVLNRAVLTAQGKTIKVEDLQFAPRAARDQTAYEYSLPEGQMVKKPAPRTLREIEKEKILQELEKNRWNKKETARVLGIAKSTLFEKIKRYNIDDQGGED